MAPTTFKGVSDRDAMFMLAVVMNTEGAPKVNWEKVAQDMGLKSGGVASVRFGQIKRKMIANKPSGGGNVPENVTKMPKVASKKRKAAIKDEPEDEIDHGLDWFEGNNDVVTKRLRTSIPETPEDADTYVNFADGF